jgi:hypothetical protein
VRDGFTKENYIRPYDPSTLAVGRQCFQRNFFGFNPITAFHAISHSMISVELDHIIIPGFMVKTVNVLSDNRAQKAKFLQLSKTQVPWIWACL